MMWRYNWLVSRGWKPLTVDKHEISNYGIYYTNVLMSKGPKRKRIRLDGIWDLSVLTTMKDKEE